MFLRPGTCARSATRSLFLLLVSLPVTACVLPEDSVDGGEPPPAWGDSSVPPVVVQDGGIGTPPIVVYDAGAPPLGADASVPPVGLDAGVPPVGVDASVPPGAVDAGPVDASVPHADLGKGNGKDVIMIGDSWMSNTLQLEGTNGGISTSLTTLSKQPYRNYAVQGVMMLTSSLFGAAIPTQWDDALRANPDIKTVIMTAGGNDIIQNATLSDSCAAGTDACAKKLEEIRVALANLWAKMSAKGVADIVHVTYSSAAGNVKYFDKNVEDIKATCAAVPGPARCHVVETTAIVSKSDLAVDGIHPVKAANDRIAKAILDRMAQEGVRR